MPKTWLWFVKLIVTAALLLTCCWVAPRYFDRIPQFAPTTTDEVQFVVLNRYLQLPVRDISLVGSSLSFRLKEEFFERGDVRNLALPGGSALTGLTLIQIDKIRHPMIVVVESTIFDRGIDTDLLQKVAHHKQFILRPLRSLAAFYQSSRELKEPTFDAIKKSTILDTQAATYDNAKNVRDTLSAWNKPNYDKSIRDNANLAKTLVNELEARGIKVFFYEPPVSPQLSQSHYLETIRNSLKGEFFERKRDRWLTLDYSGEELRWEDAIHLDERSAIIVSSLLEKALGEKVPPGQRLHRK